MVFEEFQWLPLALLQPSSSFLPGFFEVAEAIIDRTNLEAVQVLNWRFNGDFMISW